MRLLHQSDDGTYSLTRDLIGTNSVPPYAILSHTWYLDFEEVTFDDLISGTGTGKRGFEKIRFCGDQARQDGLEYFWIDTCCINKPNYTELSQAINSMFRWYQQASKCYVYLSDVPGDNADQAILEDSLESTYNLAFRNSRWFTRGWTLQELIAPPSVEFFSSEGKRLGDKQSLQDQIHDITGIPIQALQGSHLSQYSITERLSWVAGRDTTIEEDQVYCVLGIFEVHLPLIYGEGKENALRRLQQEITTIKDNESTNACLEGLDAANQTRFRAQTLQRSQGTWAWISTHPQYLTWFNNDRSSLLWVTAKAGCGKTTAAARISQLVTGTSLNEGVACSQANVQSVLLFYFFQRTNDEGERSGLAALRTLASQLVREVPQVLPILLARHARLSAKGSFEWSWRNLSSVLREMLENTPFKIRVHIVLDGIDECAESSRTQIIDWMTGFVDEPHTSASTPAKYCVKILATSRPDGNILDLLDGIPTLEIQETDTADDIRALIHSRVEDFARLRHLKPDVTMNIIQTLENNAQGMFIWVILVIQELEQRDERLSDSVIASKLSRIPLTLIDTYKAILLKAPSTRREDMWRIMRWLLFACRNLTLEELEEGLCLETGETGWHGFASDVEYLCGPLIRFDGPRREINFVHQTARGFLEAYTQTASAEDVSNIPVTAQAAHDHLGTICVQYLLGLDAVYLPSLLSVTRSYEHYISTLDDFLSRFAFLRYAVESWFGHIRALNPPSPVLISLLTMLLSSPRHRANLMVLTVYLFKHRSAHVPLVHTALHLAAYFNLPSLIPLFLSQPDITVNIVADTGDTPLLWAAEMGATECVQALLDAGADPNRVEYDGWSALHWAARNGHVEVARLLLRHGARMEHRDGKGHTALDWAVDRERGEVVEVIEKWGGGTQDGGRVERLRMARMGAEWTVKRRATTATWRLTDIRP